MYACSICRMAAFLDRPTLPIHLFAPPRRKIGSIFAFLITKNKYERFRLSRHGGECMAVCGCVVRMPCRRELPMQLDFRPKPKPKPKLSHCDDGAARRKGEFNRLDQRAVVAHHCVAVKHDVRRRCRPRRRRQGPEARMPRAVLRRCVNYNRACK